MVVEDSSVSTTIMAEENLDPNTTISTRKEKHVPAIRAKSGDEEGPPIMCGGNDYASKKSTTVIQHSHSFQRSWTFWFDNPSSKSYQATWGSSLRSLYTFATIEEFWRWELLLHTSLSSRFVGSFFGFGRRSKLEWIWNPSIRWFLLTISFVL